MKDPYDLNKEYYERNAKFYEESSWYFHNKYKDRALTAEIKKCLGSINKRQISVLELGPGTGYLLSKISIYKTIEFSYAGIEHSREMSNILKERYQNKVDRFNIINESITLGLLQKISAEQKYDLILGSSILHHLPDYEDIIKYLPSLLNNKGVIYFVREPIYKIECAPKTIIQNVSNSVYSNINNFLMIPSIKHFLWPWKLKQEDPIKIAIHMFTNGVSINGFMDLVKTNFKIILYRKYNRRASVLFSYIENKWLKLTRKDIFGNTMFAIGIQKK